MKISPIGLYSPNYNVQNIRNISKPVTFCASNSEDKFVKSDMSSLRKSSNLNILMASMIMADQETRKAGKIIYSNAKHALKAGKKVNYINYKARSSSDDTGETKLIFGDFDEKTSIPKRFSLVDPETLKTKCTYEFKDTEHPLDSFKYTRYDEDGIYEHELCGKKVTAFSQREYGSNIEKSMILNPYGFSYIEAKVSDEEGVDPEIVQSLSYSIIKNNETGIYREYNNGSQIEYSFDSNSNNWVKTSK